MFEEYKPAPLFSTHGISGRTIERENRVTSAFLATVQATPQLFVYLIKSKLSSANAQKLPMLREKDGVSNLSNAYQPQAKLLNDETLIPDGYVAIKGTGSSYWDALIEVKTGTDDLPYQQMHKYVELADENNIKGLITISHEVFPLSNHVHFDELEKEYPHIQFVHFSWMEIRFLLKQFLNDEENSSLTSLWVVQELLNYLEHTHSGANLPTSMGKHWTRFLDDVRDRLLESQSQSPNLIEIRTNLLKLPAYGRMMLETYHGQRVNTYLVPDKLRMNLTLNEVQETVQQNLLLHQEYYITYRLPNLLNLTDAEFLSTVDFNRRAFHFKTFARSGYTTEGRSYSYFYKILTALQQLECYPKIAITLRAKHSRNVDAFTLASKIRNQKDLQTTYPGMPYEMGIQLSSPIDTSQRGFMQSYFDFFMLNFNILEVIDTIPSQPKTIEDIEANLSFVEPNRTEEETSSESPSIPSVTSSLFTVAGEEVFKTPQSTE